MKFPWPTRPYPRKRFTRNLDGRPVEAASLAHAFRKMGCWLGTGDEHPLNDSAHRILVGDLATKYWYGWHHPKYGWLGRSLVDAEYVLGAFLKEDRDPAPPVEPSRTKYKTIRAGLGQEGV